MSGPASVVHSSGLGYPEAPVPLPDGPVVVAELARSRGCVTLIDPAGAHRRIAETGRPNGLALDRDGVLWVAESLEPAVLRLTFDGTVERTADRVAGEPLLWPDDVCLGPDGAVYLTDSGVLVSDFMDGDVPREGWATLPLDGKVFRLDPSGGDGRVIDRGLAFVNGIAFGPDGLLYVSETMTGNVYRYDASWRRQLFGNVLDPECPGDGFRGPDGMAFDANGLLYVAVFGQGDITVLDGGGDLVCRERLQGSAPTNCAFSRDGTAALLVAEDEHGTIGRLELGVDGAQLWT